MHLLPFKGTQNVKTREVLERGLLATFRATRGALARYNKQGLGFKEEYISRFSRNRLLTIIEKLSGSPVMKRYGASLRRAGEGACPYRGVGAIGLLLVPR